jgi:DNA-directed RNA polymerase subunit RPC12/RpoP
MSSIRRIAPKHCSRCHAENSLFLDDDRILTCRQCGEKQSKPKEAAKAPEEDPRKRWTVSYGTPLTGELDRWAETKFHSGMAFVARGMYEEALVSLRQAVDQQRDFLDACLWIARLSTDPNEKREHYGEVLAHIPNQLEATRELMVLNGQLSREEADRSMNSDEQTEMEADIPVKAQLIEIDCSNCGGSLEVPAGQSEVQCQFCGHVQEIEVKRGTGIQSLTMAMLKARGQEVKWRVGKHLLHCDNCGAERIITSDSMTVECPFCGSDHVIKANALQSFMQPDGLIPFALNQGTAETLIEKELNSSFEKLKGFFGNNRPKSIRYTPVFLPFWLFDIVAQIVVTSRRRQRGKSDSPFGDMYGTSSPSERNEFGDALNNFPYCGTNTPPRNLTSRLEPYDYSSVVPYDPKRLANVTAQIYSIDFQKASIGIRKDIKEWFHFRHGQDSFDKEVISVSHLIQQMQFRLVLLPVWVATILEDDGDVRLGLVHGQKGKVILGKAYKP